MEHPGIFTIGHSTHRLPEFIDLLDSHQVEQVADVRAHPGSRRLPWFARATLAHELPRRGVAYVHLPQLGGWRRPGPDSPELSLARRGLSRLRHHMTSAEFETGLAILQTLATTHATALMCAEGLWWRCHRRLLSDALTVRGWSVMHIAPDGALLEHELTSFAVVHAGRLTYPPPQATLDAVASPCIAATTGERARQDSNL